MNEQFFSDKVLRKKNKKKTIHYNLHHIPLPRWLAVMETCELRLGFALETCLET